MYINIFSVLKMYVDDISIGACVPYTCIKIIEMLGKCVKIIDLRIKIGK